jgi:regulator of replication initiation timing
MEGVMIKRYHFDKDPIADCFCEIVQRFDGELCYISDHLATLEEAGKEKDKEIARLRSFMKPDDVEEYNSLRAETEEDRLRIATLEATVGEKEAVIGRLAKTNEDRLKTITAYYPIVDGLKAEIAAARETVADQQIELVTLRRDYERVSGLLVEAREKNAILTTENERLREALDTIESMATDSTFDIQGIAKATLKGEPKEVGNE